MNEEFVTIIKRIFRNKIFFANIKLSSLYEEQLQMQP